MACTLRVAAVLRALLPVLRARGELVARTLRELYGQLALRAAQLFSQVLQVLWRARGVACTWGSSSALLATQLATGLASVAREGALTRGAAGTAPGTHGQTREGTIPQGSEGLHEVVGADSIESCALAH